MTDWADRGRSVRTDVVVFMVAALSACRAEVPDEWVRQLNELHHPIVLQADVDDLSDLSFLPDLVGDRRFVQLGENGHGVAEFSTAKVRIIRYLHEYLGFDVVAFESALVHCLLADLALHDGGGVRDLWSCPTGVWRTAEVRELLQYIVDTQATSRPMHIAGFDVIIGPQARPQTEVFRALIEPVDPVYAERVAAFDSTSLDHLIAEDFDYVLDHDRDMVESYERLAAFLERTAGIDPASSAAWREGAQIARSMAGFVRQGAASLRDGGNAGYTVRDSAMAQNAAYLAEHVFPDENMVLWAHNAHVRELRGPTRPTRFKSMGRWLVERWGDEVFTVGLFMGGGTVRSNSGEHYSVVDPRPGELEDILSRARADAFVIGMDSYPAEVDSGWTHRPLVSRKDGTDREWFAPAEQFDAILFVREVLPARPR